MDHMGIRMLSMETLGPLKGLQMDHIGIRLLSMEALGPFKGLPMDQRGIRILSAILENQRKEHAQ